MPGIARHALFCRTKLPAMTTTDTLYAISGNKVESLLMTDDALVDWQAFITDAVLRKVCIDTSA